MRIGVAVLFLGRALAVAGARPGFDEEAVQANSALEEKAVRVHAHDAARQGGASNASRASVRGGLPIKVFQLNILAEGLANDGFLGPRPTDTKRSFFSRVQDVSRLVRGMKEMKVPKDDQGKPKFTDKDRPKIFSNEAKRTEALMVEPLPVANLLDPKEVGIETEFSTRRVNWYYRKNAISDLIRKANPDVITMQEVDNYEDMHVLLNSWGYTSIRPPSTDGLEPTQTYSFLMLERLKAMDKVLADTETELEGLTKKQVELKQVVADAKMEAKFATDSFEAYDEMLMRCQKEQDTDKTDEVEVQVVHRTRSHSVSVSDVDPPPVPSSRERSRSVTSDVFPSMPISLDCGSQEMKAIMKMHEDSNLLMRQKASAVEKAESDFADVEAEIKAFPQKQQAAVDDEYDKHLALLAKNGIAFAPKANSNARKVWKKNMKGIASVDEELFKDDEGSVIFWKSSKLKLASDQTDHVLVVRQELSLPGDSKAAVRVILESVDNPEIKFAVITTHLASGPEKELRRQFELNSIYLRLKEPIEEIFPVIFSADLNSDINFDFYQKRIDGTPMQKALATSCFNLVTGLAAVKSLEPIDKKSKKFKPEKQTLKGWNMQSIYRVDQPPRDDLEGTEGEHTHRNPLEIDRRPPTVLKMRGPGTDQPHKMGEFQLETIDHIFFGNPVKGPKIAFVIDTDDLKDIELLGPALPRLTALQMRAYSKLLDEGIAMGEEVASIDGTLYWRRGARDSNIDDYHYGLYHASIPLNGLSEYGYDVQPEDPELNEITQHMLPSFFHPSDHLAVVAEFDVYPAPKEEVIDKPPTEPIVIDD